MGTTIIMTRVYNTEEEKKTPRHTYFFIYILVEILKSAFETFLCEEASQIERKEES